MDPARCLVYQTLESPSDMHEVDRRREDHPIRRYDPVQYLLSIIRLETAGSLSNTLLTTYTVIYPMITQVQNSHLDIMSFEQICD